MGLQGVPYFRLIPRIAVYSVIRAFISSGPLSERKSDGIVPLRNMHSANIRRASTAFARGAWDVKIPWHKVQMKVMVKSTLFSR